MKDATGTPRGSRSVAAVLGDIDQATSGSPGAVPEHLLTRARKTLEGSVQRTPILASAATEQFLPAGTVIKAEHLQVSGSFKFRGAFFRLASMTPEARQGGVVIVSSGNGGAALALAASIAGVPCTVVVPDHASDAKVEAATRHGARVLRGGTHSADVFAVAAALRQREGLTEIHVFEDPEMIAGAATVTTEVLEQWPAVRRIVAPASAGSLLAGAALACRVAGRTDVELIACQPEHSRSLTRSLAAGRVVEVPEPSSVGEGLRSQRCGQRALEILRAYPRVTTSAVSDESILRAVRATWLHLRQVVEPSGAAGIAAVLDEPSLGGQGTVIVTTGGNMTLERFEEILAGGEG